jgi:gliding motility-associated-like protein
MGLKLKPLFTQLSLCILGVFGLLHIWAFTTPEPITPQKQASDLAKTHHFIVPAVAVDDAYSLDADNLLLFNPTLNDTLNGRFISLAIMSAPKHGSIGFSAVDTLIYKPNPGYCGNDTLFYGLSNETYTYDTAMVIVTVRCGVKPTEKAPALADDAFLVYKNVSTNLTILENDTLNNDLVSPLSIVQLPTHGTALVSINSLIYASEPDFCEGFDTLRYAICNASGCDTATVIIQILCAPDNTNANLPIALDDKIFMKRNAFHVFRPTLNDTLKGTLSGVSIVKNSKFGALGFVGLDTLVYMPQMGYCGKDTVSYRVCNTLFLCDTATIFMDIECTQDIETLTQASDAVDDAATTLENQPVSISVLTNDNLIGIMNTPLSIVSYPSNGMAIISHNDVNYTPNTGFCGGADTISYRICNGFGCDTALVIVQVNCDLNPRVDAPIAKNDYISTDRNNPVEFYPTKNDTINGTLLALGFVLTPKHGTLNLIGKDTLVYKPDLNYCGTDTLEYRICRPDLKCDTAFIFFNINCTPVGEKSDAKQDVATTLKNQSTKIYVLINDALNGTLTLPLSISTQPKYGTVQVTTENDILYTPTPDFCGKKDSFSYEICNINGCDTALVIVDILCESPNQPIATNDAALIFNGKKIEINVLANDTLNSFLDSITILTQPKNALATIQNNNIIYNADPLFCNGYDTLTYEICTIGGCDTAILVAFVLCDTVKNLAPIAQNDTLEMFQGRSLTINALQNDSLFNEPVINVTLVNIPQQGTVSVDNTKNIVYKPRLAFCNEMETLTYSICTSSGCDTATVAIKVICDTVINQPPVANADIAFTLKNVGVMIPILANDSVLAADTIRIIRFAKHGMVSVDTTSKQLFYQSNSTFCGGFDSLVYEICNFKGCDTGLVVIAVACDTVAKKAPIANFDTARVEINSSVLIPILKNDSLNNHILLETSVQPKHGIVSFKDNNSAYYVPISEFWGRDSFIYIICNLSGCDTAMVHVMVHNGKNLVVYNAFSPNGDGMNDDLIIRGIENYPNNEVLIYNRWGNEIFKRKGYKNDEGWRGDWNGQIVMDGTYFYLIFLNDEKKQVKTGYIQVHR